MGSYRAVALEAEEAIERAVPEIMLNSERLLNNGWNDFFLLQI